LLTCYPARRADQIAEEIAVAASNASPLSANFWQQWKNFMPPLYPMSEDSAAPKELNQPILPWSFTGLVVNESNSSNPAAERAIVSEESYGRQLGRISDALAFLIDQSCDDKSIRAIKDFLDMRKKIEAIKNETEDSRFDRVLADLERLRASDEIAFKDRLARVNALAKK
jgi:hypothetical protein